jgi:hypothetical protein
MMLRDCQSVYYFSSNFMLSCSSAHVQQMIAQKALPLLQQPYKFVHKSMLFYDSLQYTSRNLAFKQVHCSVKEWLETQASNSGILPHRHHKLNEESFSTTGIIHPQRDFDWNPRVTVWLNTFAFLKENNVIVLSELQVLLYMIQRESSLCQLGYPYRLELQHNIASHSVSNVFTRILPF